MFCGRCVPRTKFESLCIKLGCGHWRINTRCYQAESSTFSTTFGGNFDIFPMYIIYMGLTVTAHWTDSLDLDNVNIANITIQNVGSTGDNSYGATHFDKIEFSLACQTNFKSAVDVINITLSHPQLEGLLLYLIFLFFFRISYLIWQLCRRDLDTNIVAVKIARQCSTGSYMFDKKGT